jgi:hypothetical protein
MYSTAVMVLRAMMGLAPMPLRYSGAHTHRLSGEWKINVQNLRKGGKLRQSLRAPVGFKVAGDQKGFDEALQPKRGGLPSA